MSSRLHIFAAVCLCLVFAASVPGCTKKMTITQYPEWWTPEMENVAIAVVPFRNQTNDSRAAEILSDELANALRANGRTYRSVFNRNDLRTVLDQQDLQQALSDNANLAAQMRGDATLDVTAILVGTVTTYACTTRSEHRVEPQTIYDNKGNAIGVSNKQYTHTRNEGNVTATAALVRVTDGSTIYATSTPATWQAYAEGSPPSADQYACLADARRNVVQQLLAQFAVTLQEIEVKEKDAFRTARDLYDNQWEWANKFTTADEKAFIVTTLPVCCDRNRFRITIVREDQRQDLWETDLTWSREFGGRGLEFSPAEIARKGGGAGNYVAKFYSGSEPKLTCKFKIEQPK